jgi:D-alanyl-D-alanine carboxypeptidase/D-alanyl-D-alanine-endopeptidase (penicillin-binding protein 4)
MKYLGDSLPGLRYSLENQYLIIQPTGDPTFLHPDFKTQKVFDFLKLTDKKIFLNKNIWESEPLGRGWAWDDYEADYMPERSFMPIYGNVIRFQNNYKTLKIVPDYFSHNIEMDSTESWEMYPSKMKRERTGNKLSIRGISKTDKLSDVPFFTENGETIYSLLNDTLKKQINKYSLGGQGKINGKVIYSQPSDSLFTIMMHRSDNFFAEQTLLMASNEKLGYMSDQKMIDTLLKIDLKDIPQKPKWVDGSGLSRYNLFTPKDFIYILQKLKNEFGFERLKVILPTGGTGTLSSLYKKDSGYIFAKSGTLSNHVALSGFLITKKNKFLLFSVLAGNFITGANPIRKAIEKFLSDIRQRY